MTASGILSEGLAKAPVKFAQQYGSNDVQVVDVCGVMLAVVKFQRPRVDVRLERAHGKR